ncbi:hypothetical protein T10_8873 [Trichinella papuae]|uniref:Uncharacterized protein n=1 Tax=Trichinella papuae TaxID=268474 RepID=A0A0V1N2A4_9BILA|nr:hypothetical protein T10_8873 [Trichinella papuae]
MWRYLYVVREGFGLGNWSLVDSGDCSRFKLVWVNAILISGHYYYYWQRLGCSAQKVLSFSGSVDLMK